MARAVKAGKNAQTPPPSESTFIEWFFRPAMLFRMSLVAGVFAMWPYAIQKLPSLGSRAEYQIPFSSIELIPEPERPVPMNLLEQVADQSGMPRDLSILSENVTFELTKAFRRHPWVSKVVRVRKSYPAKITVELEYRKPVMMAQVQGGRIPVDLYGVILPTSDFSATDASQYPLLQNVPSRPKVRPGSAWEDPAILAAARVADALSEHWQSLKLEAILMPKLKDSSVQPNDVILELLGKGGSKIVWGRPPGSDHPGELESTQKIRRLEKYLADFGDYNQPHGPYEIDIRHWEEISRRPLSGEPQPHKLVKPTRPQSKQPADTNSGKLREAKKTGGDSRK